MTAGPADDTAAIWLETGRLAELGLYAATLVHELRQPLFAVKALAQMMQTDDGAENGPRLEQLLAQVDIIEQLITRYDGSGRRPEPTLAPMVLSDVVHNATALLEGVARRNGKSLLLKASPDAVLVIADPVSVHQVTVNLVRNAIDAARNLVVVTIDGSMLAVRDDGAGIPEDVRGRIFDLFVTTKPPGEGTGLGLAVTRRLVEALSGTLEFRTGVDGTTFEARFKPAGPASS